jgi:hypothetical protein
MKGEPPGDRQLVVAHHHPGRLRVRSRSFERDPALVETIERWLTEQPGVREVRSHAPTGSILVAYDPSRADVGELLVAIAARTCLALVEPSAAGPPAQRIFDAARGLDDRVLELSGGRFGLGIVVPVALGLGSIASFVSSAHVRAPRWDNLLYWAVQMFRAMNEDPRPRRRSDANGA